MEETRDAHTNKFTYIHYTPRIPVQSTIVLVCAVAPMPPTLRAHFYGVERCLVNNALSEVGTGAKTHIPLAASLVQYGLLQPLPGLLLAVLLTERRVGQAGRLPTNRKTATAPMRAPRGWGPHLMLRAEEAPAAPGVHSTSEICCARRLARPWGIGDVVAPLAAARVPTQHPGARGASTSSLASPS